MDRFLSTSARNAQGPPAGATPRRGLAATLLAPIFLGAIALVETGLRGVRKALVRMRGATPTPADAAEGPAPARVGEDVGREEPRAVGPEGARAVGRARSAERGPEASTGELPALLARGDALPTAYGDDRVVLLARDPFCLFAYWDLAPSRWHAVEREAASERVRRILRVSDVTQIPFAGAGAVRHRDLEIAEPVGSSYVWIETPGRSYVAEVGYVRADGTFVSLARSNLAWAPRAERPGSDPIRWMTVRWTGRPEWTYPAVGAAPLVRREVRSARAVSSFDAQRRGPASEEHADRRAPRSDGARLGEPAPTNGRE